MGIITCSRDLINASRQNTGSNLFLIDGVLYKVFCDTSFQAEKERNIEYLISRRPVKPYVLDKIVGTNELIGYTQEFIPLAKTFKDGIDSPDYDKKFKAILDVFKSIKKIHDGGFIIGDVHAKNFIYNDDGGYLIDLDEMRDPKTDDWKFRDYYLVKNHENSSPIRAENKYTDIVKATIASLSMLLRFDLEESVKDESLDSIKPYIDWLISDSSVKNQLFDMFDCPDQIVYLDDIIEGKEKILIK